MYDLSPQMQWNLLGKSQCSFYNLGRGIESGSHGGRLPYQGSFCFQLMDLVCLVGELGAFLQSFESFSTKQSCCKGTLIPPVKLWATRQC